MALEVDEIVAEQDLVVKPLSSRPTPPPYVLGYSLLSEATVPRDGSAGVDGIPCLVLDSGFANCGPQPHNCPPAQPHPLP
ncbi:MAG: hypothetical protein HC818_03285 [Synechococcaceae cyanobacterium RM1_1_27]|nr:hypothetical protein [Synechococcaceae cyanobacterium RM1_1_27]